MKNWFKTGIPWIWLNAGALAISLIAVLGLLILIATRGMSHFWPATVYELDYINANGESVRVIGEEHSSEEVTAERLRTAGQTLPDGVDGIVTRYLMKVGNREVYGIDFLWMVKPRIQDRRVPEDIVVLERHEWGNFYGYLKSVKNHGQIIATGDESWADLQPLLERAYDLHEQIKEIERGDIGAINYGLERLRLEKRGLELDGITDQEPYDELAEEKKALEAEYVVLQTKLNELYKKSKRDALVMEAMNGEEIEIPLHQVVYAFKPNAMGLADKLGHYGHKIGEFIFDEPREANTEGGIFPAIFGTVMMVILMAVLVTPFGVVAAVYLREYAKQGPLTRTIRVAVNNLAGVPSIVYGVFGLGFFVYFLGGSIDELFFPEAYPAPTFGTPGILWSSLTLAILTLPVVIVSTEEGLARIPRALREGSLALGATHFETIRKVILPMASPAMMTGLILAVARAAGEVAPLMLVGVVKLAPTLPLDANFPYLHLERKFMHLGFHIYDVGFQSPNVEAARPLVYATAFLLVLVIIGLNLSAVGIRNRLREKYRQLDH